MFSNNVSSEACSKELFDLRDRIETATIQTPRILSKVMTVTLDG